MDPPANLGVRVRAGGLAAYVDVGDEPGMPMTGARITLGTAIPAGAAVAYALAPGKLDVLVEGFALVPLAGACYAPIEALAAVNVHLARASHLTIGGGLGLGADAGNPDARGFLAIVFEPGRGTTARTVVTSTAIASATTPTCARRWPRTATVSTTMTAAPTTI